MPSINTPNIIRPQDHENFLARTVTGAGSRISKDELNRRATMKGKKWEQDNVFDRLRIKLAEREKSPACGKVLVDLETAQKPSGEVLWMNEE